QRRQRRARFLGLYVRKLRSDHQPVPPPGRRVGLSRRAQLDRRQWLRPGGIRTLRRRGPDRPGSAKPVGEETHMSFNPISSISPDDVAAESIATLIIPRTRDLGDFEVRRALPAPRRQMVG